MSSSNPFNQSIDSLPYYDRDLDQHPELRGRINAEIAVELRSILPSTSTSTPTNLTHLSAPRDLPSTSTLLGHELARVQSKKPIPAGEGLDTSRYAMPAPAGKEAKKVDAWEKAYDSSNAQLEHQRLRTLNGQLLQQLGANAWKVQNFALENTIQKVENEGEEVRKAVEEINRDRKRSQEQGGEILTRMEKKWTELVSGNMQLEIGCMALEQEVAQLQQRYNELQSRLQTVA